MPSVLPSRSAQWNVYHRAVAHDLGLIDDPIAEKLLVRSFVARLALVRLVGRLSARYMRRVVRQVEEQVDRTEFFDQLLVDAVERGARQVVLVGAGYDTRAERLARPGITFFELDLPATQRDKRGRLARAAGPDQGIRFCEVDLLEESPVRCLQAAGLCGLPTFVLCEGILRYLSDSAVRRTLLSLAACVGPGSSLAATVAFQRTGWKAMTGRAARLPLRAFERALTSEASRLAVEPDALRSLLDECGWQAMDNRSDVPPFRYLTAERSGRPTPPPSASGGAPSPRRTRRRPSRPLE